MQQRGFSLLEVMVVVAVVGLGSTVAVFAMSEQVGNARSRSDRIGLALKLKTERDRARERLTGLSISRDNDDPHTVIFHKPIFGGALGARTCIHGVEVARAHFAQAKLDLPPSQPLCLDENGLPIGTFTTTVVGDDGATDIITIDGGGTLDNKYAGGGPATNDPIPPIPQ